MSSPVVSANHGPAESLGCCSFALASTEELCRQDAGSQLSIDPATKESAGSRLSARPLPEKPTPPARVALDAALQFDWQAPAGVQWSALPRDLGIRLARSEYAEAKLKLDKRLTEQLQAAAMRRPLEYQWRMQVMARIEPESALFGSEGLRRSTQAIESEYAGAALAGTAGHPEMQEWGDAGASEHERGGKGSWPGRRLGMSASVPNLQTSQRHSQRVEQYLADARTKRRDGGKARLNAVALLERSLKPPSLDSESDAPAASPKLKRMGFRDSSEDRAELKPKIRVLQRQPTVLRHMQLDDTLAHKTLSEQLADALLVTGDSIIDIFRSWDGNSSGCIDKNEFAKAIRKLGYKGPQHDIECAFDMFDGDGSGFLGYDELAKQLRARPSVAGHA
jgi:hypothetical protein